MRTDAMSLAAFRFSEDHYWFHLRDSVWVVGLTDFAQTSLGTFVSISLPLPGAWFQRGDPIGEIEILDSERIHIRLYSYARLHVHIRVHASKALWMLSAAKFTPMTSEAIASVLNSTGHQMPPLMRP